jgi:rubrerythrin
VEQNDAQGNIPSGPGTTEGESAISRKAFLIETLGISAGVSALLAEIGAPARAEGKRAISTAAWIGSQFNEEAQVGAKYAAFAVQAKADGYPQAARLFQALVAAETFHAEWLLHLMGGLKSTADNLKAAADYEAYLSSKVLPAAAAQAEHEKDDKAEVLFEHLAGACRVHEKVLRQARERLLAGQDMERQPIRICPRCGAVLVGIIPDRCPVCATSNAQFIDVA